MTTQERLNKILEINDKIADNAENNLQGVANVTIGQQELIAQLIQIYIDQEKRISDLENQHVSYGK